MLFFFWLSLSESWTELEKHSHTSPPSNCEFIPNCVTFLLCAAATFDHFVPFLMTLFPHWALSSVPTGRAPVRQGFAFTLVSSGQRCTPASRSSQEQFREGGIPGSKMYCRSSANKCKGEIMIFRRFAAFAGGIRLWSQLQWSNQARFGSGLDWPHLLSFKSLLCHATPMNQVVLHIKGCYCPASLASFYLFVYSWAYAWNFHQ